MTKTFRATLFALIISLAASVGSALADGGRIWIYPYSWDGSEPQDYPKAIVGSTEARPKLPRYVVDEINEPSATGGLLTSDVDFTRNPPLGLDPRDLLPASGNRVLDHTGALVRAQGGNESDDGVVGRILGSWQRAIIAWNGYSDSRGLMTLIIDPAEHIECERDAAFLNVVPLPGRPIGAEPVEASVFDMSRNNLYAKLGMGNLIEERFGKTIGPRNVFVWKLDDVEEFQRNVQSYVAKKFKGRAAALVTKDAVRTIEYYLEKGFRYFAFELSIARGGENLIQYRAPIAYTCVATHCFLPLVTTNFGGSDVYKGFNAIVLSPGAIKINGAIRRISPETDDRELTSEEAKLVGGRNARIPIDELRKISPKLAEVFDPETGSVLVRNLQFSGNPGGFVKDFTAVADR